MVAAVVLKEKRIVPPIRGAVGEMWLLRASGPSLVAVIDQHSCELMISFSALALSGVVVQRGKLMTRLLFARRRCIGVEVLLDSGETNVGMSTLCHWNRL